MRILQRLQRRLRGLPSSPSPEEKANAWGRNALAALPANPPLVSVVVPHYNEQITYSRECLDSLALQTYPAIEVIVVDDGSASDSVQALQDLVDRYPNARLVTHQVNRGLAAARNTGLKLANGHWITFLDSDDYLPLHSITDRISVALATTDARAAGVYGPIRIVPEHRCFRRFEEAGFIGRSLGIKSFLSSLGDCPFSVHAVISKTEIIRACGGFNEQMRHGAEDWDLWHRVMRWGFVFFPTALSCGFYRQKQGSMIRTSSAHHIAEAKRLINSAFQPLPLGQQPPSSAPLPFQDPLGDYIAASQLFRRQVGFATLALLHGADDQAQLILGAITRSLLPYFNDIHPIAQVVRSSVGRYHGIESAAVPADFDESVDDLTRTIERLLADLEETP